MASIPGISPSEWRVMRVLWAHEPQPANGVVEALEPTTSWSPRTVKSLLNRLVKKGAVGFEKEGRTYHYFPLVEERACVGAESRSFLKRVYDGAVTPMLAHYLEHENLSAEEIAELKRILDEREVAE